MRAKTWRGVVSFLVTALLAIPMAAGCGEEEPGAAGSAEAAGASEAPAESDAPAAKGAPGPVEPLTDDAMAVAAGNTRFAVDMYRKLARDGNLFFSPYSISTALGMTAAGARGTTEREFAEALHFPLDPMAESAERGLPVHISRDRVADSFARLGRAYRAWPETDRYELNIANALWGQDGYPFKQEYLAFVEKHFGGGFNLADFQGNTEGERVRINAWVEKQTRDRIRDLIPQGGIDKATTLVLTNAVYFKGMWEAQFDKKATRDAPFHGASGDATVPMMNRKGDYLYYEDELVQVLEMPYQGNKVSMMVVLPREGRVKLAALDTSLTADMLNSWASAVREQEVRVYFPKFEMTWGTTDVSDLLIELGIREAFTSDADFSGMTDLKDLFVGPVFHKAFVAVDEEGTEAAAATAVVMKRLAIEEETVFRADRPFLFVIRENRTGGVLFMGRVSDLG